MRDARLLRELPPRPAERLPGFAHLRRDSPSLLLIHGPDDASLGRASGLLEVPPHTGWCDDARFGWCIRTWEGGRARWRHKTHTCTDGSFFRVTRAPARTLGVGVTKKWEGGVSTGLLAQSGGLHCWDKGAQAYRPASR